MLNQLENEDEMKKICLFQFTFVTIHELFSSLRYGRNNLVEKFHKLEICEKYIMYKEELKFIFNTLIERSMCG